MFNRYAYAANDPVNMIDPDGRQAAEPPASLYARMQGHTQQADVMDRVDRANSAAVLSPAPGISDAISVATAIGNPTLTNIAIAAAGLVPGVGQAAGAAKAVAKAAAEQGPRFFRGQARADAITANRLSDGSLECAYCGRDLTVEPGHPNSVTIDHIQPYSRGGPTNTENANLACQSCNSSKGNKELGTEWIALPESPTEN
jgi:hypothetical protein